MSENKNGGFSVKDGNIIVKNKKFKKSDIIALGVCVVLALFIWIYASNVKNNAQSKVENNGSEVITTVTE